MVLAYHSSLSLVDLTIGSISNYASYYLQTVLSIGVPLFFFVNGYLLLNQPFQLEKHIKKMIRLIILTCLWAVISMTVYIQMEGEQLSPRLIIMSILNMTVSWAMNIYWFLGALISIYFFFPALKALYDSNWSAYLLFTVSSVILTFGVITVNRLFDIVGSISPGLPKTINYPFLTMFNPFRISDGYAIAYFCTGGLFGRYEDQLRRIKPKRRNTIAFLSIVICSFLLFAIGLSFTKIADGETWDVVWNGYNSIFTFVNVISVFVLCMNYRDNNSLVQAVSINSLGIYFVHEWFIRLTRPWIFEHNALCSVPFHILYAFLILVFSLLVCRLIRKIPILRRMI